MRKSTGMYPENWKEIATEVKEQAGWKCVRCGHPHEPETGYTLTVHHIDLDPSNSQWWNMAALCQRCHLHIQGKVFLEQFWAFDHSPWFQPYVAGYYASLLGLPTDRRYVEQNIKSILDYIKLRGDFDWSKILEVEWKD